MYQNNYQDKHKNKYQNKFFNIIKIILFLIILLAGYFIIERLVHFTKPAVSSVASNAVHLQAGTALPQTRLLPNFELIDANNHLFSEKQLANQWSFIFFGYTQCPGICPATLGKLTELSSLVSPDTQFIFISIDPNDTSERLKTYLSQTQFKKANILGITGAPKAIQNLAQSIGLFVSEDNIPVNGHIEHSGTVLLINPDGQLMAVFSNPTNPRAIARDLKTLMHEYSRI